MFCSNCGAPNPDVAAFCNKCGKPLARPVAAPPAAQPVAQPITYVMEVTPAAASGSASSPIYLAPIATAPTGAPRAVSVSPVARGSVWTYWQWGAAGGSSRCDAFSGLPACGFRRTTS